MIKSIIALSCFLVNWVAKKIIIFRTKEDIEKNKDDHTV